jgi:hypothetical protein
VSPGLTFGRFRLFVAAVAELAFYIANIRGPRRKSGAWLQYLLVDLVRTAVLFCGTKRLWRGSVMETTDEHLMRKWRECHVENQALRREIEDLKT